MLINHNNIYECKLYNDYNEVSSIGINIKRYIHLRIQEFLKYKCYSFEEKCFYITKYY